MSEESTASVKDEPPHWDWKTYGPVKGGKRASFAEIWEAFINEYGTFSLTAHDILLEYKKRKQNYTQYDHIDRSKKDGSGAHLQQDGTWWETRPLPVHPDVVQGGVCSDLSERVEPGNGA